MYRIDFSGIKEVAHIIYLFMTNDLLVRPECTVWSDDGAPSTTVNDGSTFISETDLFRRIIRAYAPSVSCVASTDKADTRRVVLTYTPGLDFMVLNFPQAGGKLTATERAIIAELSGDDSN